MLTVLYLDDFTCGFSAAVQLLRENGYRVLPAADTATALRFATHKPLDAVVLNCGQRTDNAGIVTALRMLQPHVAVVMFSGYCGVLCTQLHLADACIQKGEPASTLLATLRSVLCQARYGLCRSVAA